MGFYSQIPGFPGFGSKDVSNPNGDKTQNDAMVNIYTLECPKPTVYCKHKGNNDAKPDRKSAGPSTLGEGATRLRGWRTNCH